MSDFIKEDPEIIGKFINEFLISVMTMIAPSLDIPEIEKCLVELYRFYTPLSQLQKSYYRVYTELMSETFARY